MNEIRRKCENNVQLKQGNDAVAFYLQCEFTFAVEACLMFVKES